MSPMPLAVTLPSYYIAVLPAERTASHSRRSASNKAGTEAAVIRDGMVCSPDRSRNRAPGAAVVLWFSVKKYGAGHIMWDMPGEMRGRRGVPQALLTETGMRQPGCGAATR